MGKANKLCALRVFDRFDEICPILSINKLKNKTKIRQCSNETKYAYIQHTIYENKSQYFKQCFFPRKIKD